MRNQLIHGERGMSLVIVALGLVMILGLAGISIDLASFYVTRNEAQRSADAAALAGANTFVTSGITIGLTTASLAQSEAAAKAVQVGNANLVVGRSPGLDVNNFNSTCPAPTGKSGGCFNFSSPTGGSATNDPRITVVVYEQMPTYFMKIFGIKSVPVSARATAEAYQPSGNGPASSAKCIKPWMMPNCDYSKPVDASKNYAANENCPVITSSMSTTYAGDYPSYFVYPQTQPAQVTAGSPTPPNEPSIPTADLGTVVYPSLSPTGAIGELMTIKAGDPQLAPSPSQFYPVFLPDPNPTFECPSCATSDQQQSTSNSAARYKEYIECCSNMQLSCGSTSVSAVTGVSATPGNKVGPTGQGVDCLIHQGAGGSGQDTISFQNEAAPTLPYTMYAGSGNPYYSQGTIITTSDSVVTMPIYDGVPLCPGGSCPASVNVNIQGWLQLFIKDEGAPAHTVEAYILNIATCGGTTTEEGGTPIPSTTGSPIPVRLIHN